jgi:transketolase
MSDILKLEKLAKLIRYWSLVSTTEAGSGHPTSSLSAADLMTGLLFGGSFRFDADKPKHPNNDRLIFSKGMRRLSFTHSGLPPERLPDRR